MTLVKLLSIIVLSTVAKLAIAAPLVNQMQGCQGILDFVNVKVSQASDLYSKNDVSVIKKGLDAYNSYIQNEIITPSIAATVANDKNKVASNYIYKNFSFDFFVCALLVWLGNSKWTF